MARRSNRQTWMLKLAFIAIVVASGAALAQNGDLRNPFTVFAQITGNQLGRFEREGFERGERSEGFQPPEAAQQGTGTDGAAIAAPEGFRRGERPEGGGRGAGRGIDDAITLNWSAFAGVLFDVWFIAAAAAVIMLIGPLVGKLIKRLRPPRRSTPPQSAMV